MMPARLEPFYYRRNFQTVLDSLAARYLDLLTAEEQGFIAAFAALPSRSSALFVRMMMRKGVLFRESKLAYPEIGAVRGAIEPLLQAGWVDAHPQLSFAQLQKLLTKSELAVCFAEVLRDLCGGKPTNKSCMVEALLPVQTGSRCFEEWCPGMSERLYELTAARLCTRFRLMFFGNFRQDWSEFVLAELGLFAYEPVAVSGLSRAFSTRSHIECFQQLFTCRELLHAGASLQEILQALPTPVYDCDWLEDRRQKLVFQTARLCERRGETCAALELYAGCRFPGARVRRIRLLECLQEWESARSLCVEALDDARGAAEMQQLQRAARRLNRRQGVGAQLERARSAMPQFELYLDKAAVDRPVEYCVRDFLAQQEPEMAVVEYVENGLITSLFGLLCWRAVFAPVPGAFFHDFHRAPADLSSAHFMRRRDREFKDCLAQLDSGEYVRTICDTYAAKSGIASPFVSWGLLTEALLARSLACFPATHLKRWFEWIAGDIQINRAGFPDLVQFWPNERRYRLIEVKGPGDRLQDNQRRLLEFCVSHEIPVAVCHVRWHLA